MRDDACNRPLIQTKVFFSPYAPPLLLLGEGVGGHRCKGENQKTKGKNQKAKIKNQKVRMITNMIHIQATIDLI